MTIDAKKFYRTNTTVDDFVLASRLEFITLKILIGKDYAEDDKNIFEYVICANLEHLKEILLSKHNKPSEHDLDLINNLNKELNNPNSNQLLIKEILQIYKSRTGLA